MRFIDEEKLFEALINLGPIEGKDELMHLLSEQDSIEAIPIDFIRRFLEKYDFTKRNRGNSSGIRALIKAWRKADLYGDYSLEE